MEEVVFLPVHTVKSFMKDVFIGLGVPDDDADICTDVLITSDLRGIDSHGIGRLKMYYDRIREGVQQPVTTIKIVKETETTCVMDGHNGMGHVIGYRAMEAAITKAKKYGLGSTAVRNSTHYGIAGYYSLMAIQQGMCGLTVTNARPSIAPTFAVDPMLGTNPLTFGAPTDETFPFLIDCATSITQRGKIEFYERANKATPAGMAIDREGNFHTDTQKLLKDLVTGDAALLPLGGMGELFGGHKGYGWATMVEILSSALQEGSYLKGLLGYDEQGTRQPYKLGHFFLALNIEHFLPLEKFKHIAGNIMRALRSSRKAPGEARIYTAGEKEYEMEKIRQKEGIPLNKNLQKNILTMKRELHLNHYTFPF
ncbi:MAG: Ldh family oxidoreductase [bacterium]